MRTAFAVALAAAACLSASAAPCAFDGEDRYISRSVLDECLDTVAFNETWRAETLKLVRAALPNYAFVDVVKDTGAPYHYNMDVFAEIDAIEAATYARDYDFQEDVARVYNKLNDAHTVYIAPVCYQQVFSVQPLRLVPVYTNGSMTLEVGSISVGGEDITTRFNPTLPVGRQVLAIDGFDPVVWVMDWARVNLPWTNDPSGAFNAATGRLDLPLRSLAQGGLPNATGVTYTLAPDPTVVPDMSTSTVAGNGAAEEFFVEYQFLELSSANNASAFHTSCLRGAPPPVINCTAVNDDAAGFGAGGRSLERVAAHREAVASLVRSLAPAQSSRRLSQPSDGPHDPVRASSLRSMAHLASRGSDVDELAERVAAFAAQVHATGGRPHAAVSENVYEAHARKARKAAVAALGSRAGDITVAAVQDGPMNGLSEPGVVSGRALAAIGGGQSGSEVLVRTIFESAADGLAVREYEDSLTSRTTTVLSVATFNPTSVSSCFAIISSTPCPTAAQEAAANACYGLAVSAFLDNAATRALDSVASSASSFLLDMVGNGGGNIVLGQQLLLALFAPLRDAPVAANTRYDLHPSDLLADMAAFSHANATALPDFPLGGLLLLSGATTTDGEGVARDPEWYTPGVMVARGARPPMPYSKQFHLLNLTSLAASFPPTRDLLEPSSTMIVSDLQCGSMCGQFAHTLASNGLAKTLGLGGVPWLGADATAFTGGFVTSDAESLTRSYEAAVGAGYTPSPGVATPVYLPTSAVTSFDFGAAVSRLQAPAHTQFVPLKPSARLMVWPGRSLTLTETALAARVEPVVPLTPLSTITNVLPFSVQCPANGDKAEAARATTLAITFGCLFGVAVLVACLLGFLLWRANKSTGHSRLTSGSDHTTVREAYPVHPAQGGGGVYNNNSAPHSPL